MMFLIDQKYHYIKYDFLKKSSRNNNVGGAYMLISHNYKTSITFDSVGILRWGFQHFGFLITFIKIMKSFKKVFEDSQDL